MNPFDDYPDKGRRLLGQPRRQGNCRHGYGLDLQKHAGATLCAYCGMSLVDDYHHWLLMCVDHVIPLSQAAELQIPDKYSKDLVNCVLACSGCNTLDNRYRVPEEWTKNLRPGELDDLLALRDRVFEDRNQRVAERRRKEMAFFDTRPWLNSKETRKAA